MFVFIRLFQPKEQLQQFPLLTKPSKAIASSKHPISTATNMEYEDEETDSSQETLPTTIIEVREHHENENSSNDHPLPPRGPLHELQQWTRRRLQFRTVGRTHETNHSTPLSRSLEDQLRNIQPMLESLKRQLREVTAQIHHHEQREEYQQHLVDHNPFFPNMQLLAHRASLEHRRRTVRLAIDYVQGLAMEWRILLDELNDARPLVQHQEQDSSSLQHSILESTRWSCSQRTLLMLPQEEQPTKQESKDIQALMMNANHASNQSTISIEEEVDMMEPSNTRAAGTSSSIISQNSNSCSSSSTILSVNPPMALPSMEQIEYHVETLQQCPPEKVNEAVQALRKALTAEPGVKGRVEEDATHTRTSTASWV